LSEGLRRAVDDPPRVWGHRGTRRGAPENTLCAFQRAIDQGADGIELDVRRCASGEVVVIHDRDLQRVAGRPERVVELGWDALSTCDVGEGERVPLLSEACALVLGSGLWLNVEVKSDGEDVVRLVDAVADVLAPLDAAWRARVVVSSFGRSAVERAAGRVAPALVASLFETLPAPPLACDGVHPRHSLVSAEAVDAWHADGRFVNAWTVNDPALVPALVAAGVDGIITDDVPAIRAAIARTHARV
jgi:glycerophosphoryl diester phosphodiesterase